VTVPNPRLLLVTLTPEQVRRAKAVNGSRKQITHAVVCGSYGQLLGTKKHCEKYYFAWKGIFANIFDGSEETSTAELTDYASTFNLVTVLFDAQTARFPSPRVTELEGLLDGAAWPTAGARTQEVGRASTRATPPGLFARLWLRLTAGRGEG
jgi:hypothetical protein